MHYLDTSFMISALMPDEVYSQRSRDWLRAMADVSLASSAWVGTEVASALAMKIRIGELTRERRAELLVEWHVLIGGLEPLSIEANDFKVAARFADQHNLGLRAGDALHVAIASRHGCTLVTLDKILGLAAPQCCVPVVTLED